jgi:hypothetical protein
VDPVIDTTNEGLMATSKLPVLFPGLFAPMITLAEAEAAVAIGVSPTPQIG